MKKRKRKKKARGNAVSILLICFVVIALCGSITYKARNLKKQSDEYAKKEAELEKQIQREEERSEKLEQQEEYMQTKKYVEEEAREKLGLVYPEEVIVKPEE